MNFSHFFIRRPDLRRRAFNVIFLVGLIAMWRLPISEYPEVVPPTIVVRATYPGANPKTIAETVASPLEQAINGVEDSLYMFSQATPDGVMTLTVTFKLGTDVDKAQVQVQNRVSQALPKLPEEVRQLGVTTTKQSPDLTMVVHLFSPNGRYDEVYLRNYATLQVKDVLGAHSRRRRCPGLRLRRLRDAPLAQSRQDRGPKPDRQRRGQRYSRTERPGCRGRSRPATGRQAGDFRTADQCQRAADFGRTNSDRSSSRRVRMAKRPCSKTSPESNWSADSYSLRSLLNNKTAVALPIFQTPGANALQLSKDVRRTMARAKEEFPGRRIDYSVVYDPTVFVRHSIEAVVHTLVEAIVLVVIVVILFLQTWRASIIPLAAVPVSLVGTFAVMLALGFSINNLSLFGLVLAIGIVVDDAIVVVENVERNIALGLSPFDAARKRAMSEVTGPIIATALVLCAVFHSDGVHQRADRPILQTVRHHDRHFDGHLRLQFADSFAGALRGAAEGSSCAERLVRPHAWKSRSAGCFRPFNRVFGWSGDQILRGVGAVLRKSAVALVVYGGLVFLTGWSFNKVPTGFVPTQDKQYLVAFAQLPDAASLDRTEAVIRRMSDIGLKQPGVESAVAFPGIKHQRLQRRTERWHRLLLS